MPRVWMTRDNRTPEQIAANVLDSKIHMIVEEIEGFADASKDSEISALAKSLNAHRGALRKYMHKDDREATL